MARFFGLMENYNLGKQMKLDLKLKIEEHFDYKWKMDKNNAVGEQDLAMLQQLPQEVQMRIFTDFLFKDFLIKYKKFFIFQNLQSKNSHAYYNWQNQDYQNFMMFFLRILEPIQLKKGMILIKEMDSVNEAYFFMDGQIDVGYEVNLKKFYKIRFRGNFQIGGFECSYNRRSQVTYKNSRNSDGYFIRKKNWSAIETDHPLFFNPIKRDCLFFYVKKIRRSVNKAKQIDMDKMNRRADFNSVLTLTDDFTSNIKEIFSSELNQQKDNQNADMQIEQSLYEMDGKFAKFNEEQVVSLSENMDQMMDQRDYHKDKNRFLRALLTEQQYF